jgi:hypothetical protein
LYLELGANYLKVYAYYIQNNDYRLFINATFAGRHTVVLTYALNTFLVIFVEGMDANVILPFVNVNSFSRSKEKDFKSK